MMVLKIVVFSVLCYLFVGDLIWRWFASKSIDREDLIDEELESMLPPEELEKTVSQALFLTRLFNTLVWPLTVIVMLAGVFSNKDDD